jgi:probable phosphoglycerate mutase
MVIRAHEAATLQEVNRLFNQEHERGLSELGREQAERVARYFERHPVDAVYSSPMARARETAEATARALGVQAREHNGIGELRTGHIRAGSLPHRIIELSSWVPERVRKEVLGFTLIPAYFLSWRRGATTGGESREQFEQRLAAFYERLRREHEPHARVAVFAHGYLILLLSLAATDGWSRLRFRRPYVANGSITEVELPAAGAPQLLRFADTAHL